MQPQRQLSLFDSVCILVGIIIGAGIYETTPMVASCMGSGGGTLAVWLVGGVLALAGSLCYAELATAYPREGGDYVYLTRALGRWCGGLFGWSQLAIVRPGDIALMAFIFARYANQLWAPLGGWGGPVLWAALIVMVLTVINILGVRSGRTTQNILTVAKVVGLLAIVGAAFLGGGAAAPASAPQPAGGASMNLQLAMILVLFVYGGWNEMAYVAAEVKEPNRNIVRALVIGAVTVTGLYALINGAFLYGLGFEAMSKSQAIAVDVVRKTLPADSAGRFIAAVICISAAGAVNGLIFTGARVTYALGTEHAMFRVLGRWHPRWGTPVAALAVQGAIALVIVVAAGSFVDTILYSAPVVWLFFTGTAISVFLLRLKEPTIDRPFRVPAFPIVPGIFLACCLFMFYNSLTYAWGVKPTALWIMAGVMVVGVPVYWVSRRIEGRRVPVVQGPA
jgi:basic amino acid/polyamine antiporter, APA family